MLQSFHLDHPKTMMTTLAHFADKHAIICRTERKALVDIRGSRIDAAIGEPIITPCCTSATREVVFLRWVHLLANHLSSLYLKLLTFDSSWSLVSLVTNHSVPAACLWGAKPHQSDGCHSTRCLVSGQFRNSFFVPREVNERITGMLDTWNRLDLYFTRCGFKRKQQRDIWFVSGI